MAETTDITMSVGLDLSNATESANRFGAVMDKALTASQKRLLTMVKNFGSFQTAGKNLSNSIVDVQSKLETTRNRLDSIDEKYTAQAKLVSELRSKIVELNYAADKYSEAAKNAFSTAKNNADYEAAIELEKEYDKIKVKLNELNEQINKNSGYIILFESLAKQETELEEKLGKLNSELVDMQKNESAAIGGMKALFGSMSAKDSAVFGDLGNQLTQKETQGKKTQQSLTMIYGEDISNTEKAQKLLDALAKSEDTATYNAKKLKEEQTRLAKSMKLTQFVLSSLKKGLTKIDATLKKVISKFIQLGKSAFNFAKTNLAKLFQNTSKEVKNTNKRLGGATSTIKKFILAGLGVRSIYFLFRKFWKMVKEGVNIVAQVDADTNKALSSIKTATYSLQKQLGALTSQLVTALAPVLTAIINLITKVVSAVTMLISAFGGKTSFKSATTQVQDYAESLDKTSKSAKEAKRYLSGLDEIAQWEDKSSDDGLAGAFEDVPVESWANDLAKKLKDVFSKLFDPIKKAWDNVGNKVIAAWKYALNSVWSLIKSIGNDFLTVWGQDATVKMFENILHIIKDIGIVVGNLARNFEIAWEKNNVGLHILEGIRDIVGIIVQGFKDMADATVAWSANLNFTPILEAINRFLESTKPLVQSVMDILGSFYTTVLLPLGNWVLEKGLPDLLDVFTAFNERINWEQIISSIKTLWEHLTPFAERVGEGLIAFIDNMTQKFADFLNSEQFSSWLQSLNDWLDSITASDVESFLSNLADIASGILTIVQALVEIVINNKDTIMEFFEKFADFMGNLSTDDVIGIIQNLAVAFISVKTAILGVSGTLAGLKLASLIKPISDIGALIVTKFSGAISMVAGIVMAFTNFFAMLKNGFNWLNEILMVIGIAVAAVGAIIIGVPAGIAAAIAAISAVVMTAVALIVNYWDEIKEFFSNIWDKVTDIIEGIWDTIERVGLSIWNTIKYIFNGIWNFIKKIINSILGGIETMVNGVIKGLNLMINALNKLEFTLPDWVPIVGGKSLGFSIPTLTEVSIPRLAQGAVIPANSPFLAMLGDQKQGTNIEAPLETIKQAVAEVVGSNNNRGGNYEFIAQINRRTLFDEMITEAKLRQSASGRNPFEFA